MGREQMRNLEVVKIGGAGAVNEFEYEKNQGQLTEQLGHQQEQAESGVERPTRAEQVKQIMADAHAKVEKRKRKAARKPSAKKTTTGRSAAKKSAAKKSAGRKSTAKKSASARKSPAKKMSRKR